MTILGSEPTSCLETASILSSYPIPHKGFWVAFNDLDELLSELNVVAVCLCGVRSHRLSWRALAQICPLPVTRSKQEAIGTPNIDYQLCVSMITIGIVANDSTRVARIVVEDSDVRMLYSSANIVVITAEGIAASKTASRAAVRTY